VCVCVCVKNKKDERSGSRVRAIYECAWEKGVCVYVCPRR
jgi:hypothetical protein